MGGGESENAKPTGDSYIKEGTGLHCGPLLYNQILRTNLVSFHSLVTGTQDNDCKLAWKAFAAPACGRYGQLDTHE